MATVNLRHGGAGYPGGATLETFVVPITLDFASLKKNDGTAYTPVSADVLQLLDVPSNCVVMGVYLARVTAMSTAGTLAIGDTDSGTGWLAATAINATGIVTPDGAYAQVATTPVAANKPKVYTAAKELTATLGGTVAADGKVVVNVVMARLLNS